MNILLISFVATIALIFGLRWFFYQNKWLDDPKKYGYQRNPIPLGVGIAFYFVFLIYSLFFLGLNQKLIAVLIAGAVITLISFLDDRYKLSALFRLSIQTVVAIFLGISGIIIPAISNPFGSPIVLDSIQWQVFGFLIIPFALLVAVFWMVFVMNAMNWLDGNPGIVSGVSTIAFAVIYLLASIQELHVIDQSQLLIMATILGGSTAAFLLFDFPKPKLLMGDSGTMFLGLMIGIMAIFSGAKFATIFIVLGIPLFDAIWTISRRIFAGKSPFQGDLEHLHHDLLRKGLSPRQVNFVYYAISVIFGISALYLQSIGKLISIMVLLLMITGLRLIIIRKTQ